MSDENKWADNFQFDFSSFTDEALASMGLTRSDLTSPETRDKALSKIKSEAMDEWLDLESTIDDMVVIAERCIGKYPGDRINGMANFYGEQMSVIADQSQGDLDPEILLQVFVFATFKLAEAKIREAQLLDGGHRVGA